jgi:hypothetical protein
VTAAVDYVKRHVTEDYLFAEDPRIVQATSYSLRVTYWKDSILNNPDRESPAYPIVYTQAHFQNAEALQLIGEATGDKSLVALASEMFAAGMGRLWAEDHFVTAIDQKGVIDAPSTDSLTSLLHIPPELLHEDVTASVETYMEQLETDAGYRAGIPEVTGRDGYHTDMVWTHEQALLHRAAHKHGLLRAQAVAERIMDYFEPEEVYFPELIDAATLVPAGNRVQYWSVETYKYFHERGVQPSPVSHEGTVRSFR